MQKSKVKEIFGATVSPGKVAFFESVGIDFIITIIVKMPESGAFIRLFGKLTVFYIGYWGFIILILSRTKLNAKAFLHEHDFHLDFIIKISFNRRLQSPFKVQI